jgi:uncharacterized repeat protein (TIGR01451 family)
MKRILLTLCLLVPAFFSSAQDEFWMQLQGIPGGAVRQAGQFETNDWVFALFDPCFLYRSLNDGQTWELVLDPSTDPNQIRKVSLSRNGVLYGDAFNGLYNFDVFRSVDGGTSWVKTDENTNIGLRVENGAGDVFGVLHQSGEKTLVRSEDGGNTWEEIWTGQLESFYLDDFGRIVVRSADAQNPLIVEDFYVSGDQGNTWHFIDNANKEAYLTILENDRYIRTASGELDTARVFTGELGNPIEQEVAPDSSIHQLNRNYEGLLRLADGRVLLNLKGVYHITEDQGLTWVQWANFHNRNPFIKPSALKSGKVLHNFQGLLCASTDDGLNWTQSFTGIYQNKSRWLDISHNPKTLWSMDESRNLFKTTDDGLTWSQAPANPSGDIPKSISYFKAFDGGEVFLVQDDKLHYSSDNGDTFSDITPPGVTNTNLINPEILFDTASNTLLFSHANGMMRSTDLGASWAAANSPEPVLQMVRHPSGRLWGISETIPLLFSDDEGITWMESANPPSAISIQIHLAPAGSLLLANYGELYTSADNGSSWVSANLPDAAWLFDMDSNAAGDLFLRGGLSGDAVYRSNNLGQNWTQLPQLSDPLHAIQKLKITELAIDQDGYLYAGLYSDNGKLYPLAKTSESTLNGAYLLGNVSKSEDTDCTTFDPEFPLNKVIIEAAGEELWYTFTDTLAGNYEMFLDTGAYVVRPRMPVSFMWDTCSAMVALNTLNDTTYADFSMPALGECPFVTVELVVPALERCFEHNIFIQYCNYGTQPADSAMLFLELDTLLSLSSSATAWTSWDGGNEAPCFPGGLDSSALAWYIPIGPLDVMECGQLSVPVSVDCEAELGQIHCITAYACPSGLCVNPPGWSGATIEAEAECTGDSVRLTLYNSGSAPSQTLDFVIVEDDVVLLQGEDDYLPGETLHFTFPSSGQYLRIESEQEPGHPVPQPVAAWMVGCNGSSPSSFSYLNQYPATSGYLTEDTDCQANIGSFDPNDKQGAPLGFGSERLIERGVEIEYLIRFQNTGTAPAKDVVIRDTLSPNLDPGSLRIGPASHPFSWYLSGEGLLEFRFEEINLPDSSSNEQASQGFVSFRISQKNNLPLGANIYNRAAIYFDFNDPVITNQTHHRIGEHFLIFSSIRETAIPSNSVNAFPNPASESTALQYPGAVQLCLFDAFGRLCSVEEVQEDGFLLLNKEHLPNGLYFILLYDKNRTVIAKSRVIFQ